MDGPVRPDVELPSPASLALPEFRRRIDATLVRASCRCCARQALKPVALRADPPRRSDGASCLVGQNLDWLAATPIPPRPPRSPPTDLDRASDLRGPSCPAAMRTLAAPPPCCSPASPCHRPAALTVSLWRPGAPTGCCGGPARRPFAILIGPATSGANCPAAMRTYSPPRRPAEVLPRCLTVPPRSQSHRETVPRHWWRWQTAFPAPAPAAASLSRCLAVPAQSRRQP